MAAQMETEHNDDEVRRERAVMTIQGRSPPSSRGGIIRQWLQPSAMRMEDENTAHALRGQKWRPPSLSLAQAS